MNDEKTIKSCDNCVYKGAAECPSECPPGFENKKSNAEDWRDCKVCGKHHDPAEVKRSLGDVWWLGLYCSAQCYTKAASDSLAKKIKLESEEKENDLRLKWYRKKEIQDLESGRITTRWDGIESKIDLALSLVEDEAKIKAKARGLFASPHEGYGIIAEEVVELLDAIRSNDIRDILAEAVQVAASGLVLAATIVIWEGVPEKTLNDYKEEEIEEIRDILLLCDIHVPETTIAEWTPEERRDVAFWAGQTHLLASDNDVEIPETPECLSKILVKPKTDRKAGL